MGCITALNLDGGGSTLLIVNGHIVNHPSDKIGPRPGTNVFMVVDKNKKKKYSWSQYYIPTPITVPVMLWYSW